MPKNLKSQSPASKLASQTQTSNEFTPLQQKLRQQNHIPSSTYVAPALRVAKKLSLPLYSVAHMHTLTARSIEPMFEGDMSLGDFGDADSRPTLMRVLNCDDGNEGFLICNAVIKSTLEKIEGGYVGKYFQFRDGGKAEGKRYRTVDIALMEPDE